MSHRLLCGATAALAWLVLAAAPVPAVVNSDLAASNYGGPCHPTGIAPALLDMLTLINPEWAAIMPLPSDPTLVDTAPVLVHGEVQGMHGDLSGDFPSTHLRADVNYFVLLDPADSDRLGTGNDDGLLHFEWEAGVYPAWAWAGTGDRVVGLGRWIWDCGHPGATPGACSVTTSKACVIDKDCPSGESCVGPHFAYSAELHPPYATAAIRRGRGAVVFTRPVPTPVMATRADVYVSPDGAGAGDRCIITHHANDSDLLSVQCFPLSQPVATLNAQDFVFDVPLPTRPANSHRPGWRVIPYPTPGGTPAHLTIRRRLADPANPHLEVHVRMTRPVHGVLPTGFAATILAGWKKDTSPLVHVRVTLTDLVVNNALQPATPTVPRTCSSANTACTTSADCPSGESCWGAGPVKSWGMQAAVNGEWQELVGLGTVDTSDIISQGLVYDQYIPPTGSVELDVDGRSHDCIDTIYGTSLATDLGNFGLSKGIVCLASEARDVGSLSLSYPGPDFGAGVGGSMDYETVSTGGAGGHCSTNTGLLCTVNGDCPSGETCVTTGGAFSLRYRIERLP
jgi:hypothetical protein